MILRKLYKRDQDPNLINMFMYSQLCLGNALPMLPDSTVHGCK